MFNNKGGVGKTSLVYHLAWMYAELDYNVLVADLDPQANLTSMFLDDDELEELWPRDGVGGTIYGALQPLLEGTGDVTLPHVVEPETGIGLVAGDMLLSGAEDELSSQWPPTASTGDLEHSACCRLCGAPCEWPQTQSRPTSFSWMSARTSAHSIEPRW